MAKKTVKKQKVEIKKVEIKVKKTNPRILSGKVVGNKSAKTLRVRVEVKYPHPLYTKIIRKYKSFLIHSENQVEIGQIVRFKESKPISKLKKWVLIDIVENKKN